MITIHYDLTVPPDPRDVRIASLEGEVSDLRERLSLGESAATVLVNDLGNIRQSLGARDGELTVDAAARVGAENAGLRSRVADLEASIEREAAYRREQQERQDRLAGVP